MILKNYFKFFEIEENELDIINTLLYRTFITKDSFYSLLNKNKINYKNE